MSFCWERARIIAALQKKKKKHQHAGSLAEAHPSIHLYLYIYHIYIYTATALSGRVVHQSDSGPPRCHRTKRCVARVSRDLFSFSADLSILWSAGRAGTTEAPCVTRGPIRCTNEQVFMKRRLIQLCGFYYEKRI